MSGCLLVIPRPAAKVEELFAAMAATHADFTDTFVALTDLVRDLDLRSSSSSGSSSSGSSSSSDRGAKDAAGEDAAAAAKCLEKLVSRCASPKEQEDMLRRKMKIHRLGDHPP